MHKFRILVFPCGSEIGLEIFRSLNFSTHIELIGGNSVDDHGKFVFQDYIDKIPFVDSPDFISKMRKLVSSKKIDAIFPAMDKVIWTLKINEKEIGCKILSSPAETTEICLSKRLTYEKLQNIVDVPKTYNNLKSIHKYPVFIKPVIGYGSRGVFLATNQVQLEYFFKNKNIDDFVVSEYLEGEEYTVDCFTDRQGNLRFSGPRIRNRISNGISVNTKLINDTSNEFAEIAEKINNALKLRGAWFFQVKRDANNRLKILEVASRLGGSSALYRGLGINFALLTVFDAFDYDIELIKNNYDIELDRALDNKYKIDLNYNTIYVDFDDCLIINNKVNSQLVSFLYIAFNKGKKLILITKHEGNIHKSLANFRLKHLFDEIIHVKKSDNKSNYIKDLNSIFIDDSFSERKEIKQKFNVPVLSPDMIEIL